MALAVPFTTEVSFVGKFDETHSFTLNIDRDVDSNDQTNNRNTAQPQIVVSVSDYTVELEDGSQADSDVWWAEFFISFRKGPDPVSDLFDDDFIKGFNILEWHPNGGESFGDLTDTEAIGAYTVLGQREIREEISPGKTYKLGISGLYWPNPELVPRFKPDKYERDPRVTIGDFTWFIDDESQPLFWEQNVTIPGSSKGNPVDVSCGGFPPEVESGEPFRVKANIKNDSIWFLQDVTLKFSAGTESVTETYRVNNNASTVVESPEMSIESAADAEFDVTVFQESAEDVNYEPPWLE